MVDAAVVIQLKEFVLSEDTLNPIETDKFTIARIMTAQKSSHLIKFLAGEAPLTSHDHLRRIRSQLDAQGNKVLHVLLKPSTAPIRTKLPLSQIFSDPKVLSELEALHPECWVVEVPRNQPITRDQYQQGSQLWPTFFHEDKLLESRLKPQPLTPSDMKFTSQAQDVAERYPDDQQLKCGAVIVNRDGVLQGTGFSQSNSHPLKHAVMMCIDDVARTHGGGAWSGSAARNHGGEACTQADGARTQGDGARTHGDEPWNASPKPIEEPNNSSRSTEAGYICTGYTAYLTHEPCLMCAMALLHSRIDHVHYMAKTSHGALGSRYKLHVEKRLNHRFTVSRNIRGEEPGS